MHIALHPVDNYSKYCITLAEAGAAEYSVSRRKCEKKRAVTFKGIFTCYWSTFWNKTLGTYLHAARNTQVERESGGKVGYVPPWRMLNSVGIPAFAGKINVTAR